MIRRVRLLNSRLAAATGTRQVEAIVRTDAAAARADSAVRGVWDELLDLLASVPGPAEAYYRASEILRRLVPDAKEAVREGLADVARWGHQTAARMLVRTLPVEWLRGMAIERSLGESLSFGMGGFTDLADEPAEYLTRDEESEAFMQLLFPPPPVETLGAYFIRMIGGFDFRPDLVPPDYLASIVAAGFGAGKNPQEIARDLLPAVNGVRVSARRVARTWGLHLAHKTQMDAYAGLGDMLDGYQIHATLDENTRPVHRARHGTVYYREPGPGDPGLDEMPQPPLEADGSMAWNCRCWLSPVLKPPAWAGDPARTLPFRTAQAKLVPDPATYAEWFAAADERRRRIAVGARRYSIVSGLVQSPSWEHFIDHRTGEPVSLAKLKSETPVQMGERVQKVRALIGHRRRLVRQAATFGWVGR